MRGEILDIGTAQEMAQNEKELERLRRNVNLKELENKELRKKVVRQDVEIHYLKQRDNTLTALEKSIPQRIEKYKKQKKAENVIQELLFWQDVLSMEKEKLLDKEVGNEKE